MNALGALVALPLLVSAVASAADTKGQTDKKIEAPKPVIDFKLDSGKPADGGTRPAAAGASGPAAGVPGKKELDVSRMMFDAESIRIVVKFHMPEIQECYEKVLADTGQKVQGKVVLGLIIDANGSVTEARVLPKKSTLKNDSVHDFVLQARTWQFPKAGDNRDHPIEYPFELKVQP